MALGPLPLPGRRSLLDWLALDDGRCISSSSRLHLALLLLWLLCAGPVAAEEAKIGDDPLVRPGDCLCSPASLVRRRAAAISSSPARRRLLAAAYRSRLYVFCCCCLGCLLLVVVVGSRRRQRRLAHMTPTTLPPSLPPRPPPAFSPARLSVPLGWPAWLDDAAAALLRRRACPEAEAAISCCSTLARSSSEPARWWREGVRLLLLLLLRPAEGRLLLSEAAGSSTLATEDRCGRRAEGGCGTCAGAEEWRGRGGLLRCRAEGRGGGGG